MYSNVARISVYVDPNKTTVYRTVACGGKTRSQCYQLLSSVKIELNITNLRHKITGDHNQALTAVW